MAIFPALQKLTHMCLSLKSEYDGLRSFAYTEEMIDLNILK